MLEYIIYALYSYTILEYIIHNIFLYYIPIMYYIFYNVLYLLIMYFVIHYRNIYNIFLQYIFIIHWILLNKPLKQRQELWPLLTLVCMLLPKHGANRARDLGGIFKSSQVRPFWWVQSRENNNKHVIFSLLIFPFHLSLVKHLGNHYLKYEQLWTCH